MIDQPETSTHSVFLVTDRELHRRRLTHRIGELSQCRLQGDAYTIEEALERIFQLHEVDLILVDLGLEDGDPYYVIRSLSSDSSAPPILAIGAAATDPFGEARQAFIAGAMGYLQEEEVDEMLDRAVREIQARRMFLSPAADGR